MKTTIKLTAASAMTVVNCKGPQGGVIIEICNSKRVEQLTTLHLTPDQAGVLIFSLEQALEANEVVELRKAA
jgi:hypothetical protein